MQSDGIRDHLTGRLIGEGHREFISGDGENAEVLEDTALDRAIGWRSRLVQIDALRPSRDASDGVGGTSCSRETGAPGS